MMKENRSRESGAGAGEACQAIALLVLVLGVSVVARGQRPGDSQLPPVSPTSIVPLPSAPSAHHPDVTYDGTALTVAASNSSLNQILHEIARLTGMKITGGVIDDRVFGTYGPAAPSVVIADLLDGTGSNILLVQNASHVPTELILSPRIGRVTPPNPNAASLDESDDETEIVPKPARSVAPSLTPPSATNSRAPYRAGTGGIDTIPAATAAPSTSQQLAFPPVDAANSPSTGTTTPATSDPSGEAVRTPQQIFEQLQRLRQQQSQQTAKPQ